jgi:hypothetical protein
LVTQASTLRDPFALAELVEMLNEMLGRGQSIRAEEIPVEAEKRHGAKKSCKVLLRL